MVPAGAQDSESYVKNSKYRREVLRTLGILGPSTPKEISEYTGAPRPHISRALSELREREIVELRVPESQSMGRSYGLSEDGDTLWTDLRDEIGVIEWSKIEPRNEKERETLNVVRDELGDDLRMVGVCEQEEVKVLYLYPEIPESVSEPEFEKALYTFFREQIPEGLDFAGNKCLADVAHFPDFSVLRIRTRSSTSIAVSYANEHDNKQGRLTSSLRDLWSAQ